jgi:hypothetical protein
MAIAVMLALPHSTLAQCSMPGMGGGGHDHSAMNDQASRKPSASERKLQKSIDRVLSDEVGRAMLVDALLNDRAFMERFIQQLAAIPEWKSLAVRQLSATAPAAADQNGSHVTPGNASLVYVCPMHSDVTSSSPGDCPKCGMALVRKEPR